MKIGYKIDNEDNITLVQGEDRNLIVRLFDDDTKIPIDLTGASVKFEAKSEQSTKIIRRNSALTFQDEDVDTILDSIVIPAHGLAQNEIVQLSTDGALPDGLEQSVDYYVQIVNEDTIQLALSKDGDAVDITAAAGTGTHTVEQDQITFSGANGAVLGTIAIPLPDHVTSDLKHGEKQTPEIEYTISGVTRIVELCKSLNVKEQAV